MIYRTQEELDEALAYWQKVLRLQDWDIRIRLSRSRDMFRENVQGANSITWGNKESLISLLDPIDYPEGMRWPQNHEETLIHELMHLHVDEIERFLTDEQCEQIHREKERICEGMAKAFVAFKNSLTAQKAG